MSERPSAVSVNAESCTGCGNCVTACPVDVLRLDVESGKAVVRYGRDCHVCYLCEEDCPTHSITVDHNASSERRFSIYDILDIPI